MLMGSELRQDKRPEYSYGRPNRAGGSLCTLPPPPPLQQYAVKPEPLQVPKPLQAPPHRHGMPSAQPQLPQMQHPFHAASAAARGRGMPAHWQSREQAAAARDPRLPALRIASTESDASTWTMGVPAAVRLSKFEGFKVDS